MHSASAPSRARAARVPNGGPTLSQQRTAPTPPKSGGSPKKPAATPQPQSRRERRAAEREQFRKDVSASTRPWWRSPMVLLTGGALAIGLVIVAFALLSSSSPTSAALVSPTDPTPESLWDGRAIGPTSAPATLTVYSDFQCPACDTFATKMEPQLVKDYVQTGDLRIVYKDFSFIGPESFDAAVAARCAGDQGLFWPFHDYLFSNQHGENQGAFSRDRLIQIAQAVGVKDEATFKSCLDTKPPLDATNAETAEGQGLGISSTPTLFLNGEKIVGVPAYTDLAAKIDAIVAGSPAPSGSSAPSASGSAAP
jgi:protein-disulfide isomerase